MGMRLLVLVLALAGCNASGLPLDNPTEPVADDMARAVDMTKPITVPDLAQSGDMTEVPEPMPPTLDCGYALHSACCPGGSCSVGTCDSTNHCN